jgi:hypothetical protein
MKLTLFTLVTALILSSALLTVDADACLAPNADCGLGIDGECCPGYVCESSGTDASYCTSET